MNFKLTGRNFQAWSDFSIPVKGFTVIVGPSDLGKSAILRSLRGVLRNEVSASHVSYGEKDASVTLEVEGEVITLNRSAKTTNYTVGEEEFSKLGGSIPPVIQGLKCGTVDVGGVKLDPIFASQFGSQFMLELGPTELNAIFGMFSSTEKLNSGKKIAATKNAELNATAKYLATDIQEAKVRENGLRSLLALFEAEGVELDELETLVNNLETSSNLLKNYRASYALVKSLQTAVTPVPTTAELAILVKADKEARQYRISFKRVMSYRLCSNISLDSKLSQINSSINKLDEYVSALNNKTIFTKGLKAFKGIDAIGVNSLTTIKRLDKLRKALRNTTLLSKALAERIDSSELERAVSLLKLVAGFKKLVAKQKSVETSLQGVKEEYHQVSHALGELMDDGVTCPECGCVFAIEEQ